VPVFFCDEAMDGIAGLRVEERSNLGANLIEEGLPDGAWRLRINLPRDEFLSLRSAPDRDPRLGSSDQS
jgi:hypothetical protein